MVHVAAIYRRVQRSDASVRVLFIWAKGVADNILDLSIFPLLCLPLPKFPSLGLYSVIKTLRRKVVKCSFIIRESFGKQKMNRNQHSGKGEGFYTQKLWQGCYPSNSDGNSFDKSNVWDDQPDKKCFVFWWNYSVCLVNFSWCKWTISNGIILISLCPADGNTFMHFFLLEWIHRLWGEKRDT